MYKYFIKWLRLFWCEKPNLQVWIKYSCTWYVLWQQFKALQKQQIEIVFKSKDIYRIYKFDFRDYLWNDKENSFQLIS